MSEYKEIIKELLSSDIDINKVKDYFNKNASSDEVAKKITSEKNPFAYSHFASIMQDEIDISIYDEKRDLVIKKTIEKNIADNKKTFIFFLNVTPSNYENLHLFRERELFNLQQAIKKNRFDEELYSIAECWLREYIIYYFFHENYYNYLVNLTNMLRYLRNSDESLIDDKHLQFYKECYQLGKQSFANMLTFFNKQKKHKHLQEMFYDDMRIVKNHSYQKLVESTSSLSNAFYNDELSKKYHYPIYYLDGEKFNAFIRHIKLDNKKHDNYDDYVYNNLEKDFYSFSYIGDLNISTMSYFPGITLLYNNIDPSYIVHVYHDDMGSSSANEKNFRSRKINEIHTPTSLQKETNYYNEIVVKKKRNGIIPSAVVCFDEVTDEQLAFAQKYHLLIVLINTKKYYKGDGFTDFNDYDTYTL